MIERDLRSLLDPLAIVMAARPVVRTDDSGPPRAAVDLDLLPGVALSTSAEGVTGINLGAQLALVQAAVARLADQQLRGVQAQRVFTSTLIWAAGDTRDITMTWSTAPLAPCRYAVPRLDVGVAWIGKLVASVSPDSVTDTGCTVRITATSAVVVSLAQPLTVHAEGSYFYLPPFKETP